MIAFFEYLGRTVDRWLRDVVAWVRDACHWNDEEDEGGG